jgi:hypothetical protein
MAREMVEAGLKNESRRGECKVELIISTLSVGDCRKKPLLHLTHLKFHVTLTNIQWP